MAGNYRNAGLNRVTTAQNNQELKQRYDEWAAGYEKEVVQEGWLAPKAAVEAVASRVSPEGRVLDAGAGTGAVGVELARLGFQHITGIDLSPGMLALAEEKGVYEALQEEELGTTLHLDTDAFDVTTCVATLTIGHAPPSSLDELIRVTKAGGLIVFSMRPDLYETGGFKEKQTELEEQRKWKLVEHGEPYHALPETEPDVVYETWVYEVLA